MGNATHSDNTLVAGKDKCDEHLTHRNKGCTTIPITEGNEEGKAVKKKSRYPRSCFYISGNEFCERFCFYGMKAILPLYLTSSLHFDEHTSTEIIHFFNFSSYFLAVGGSILSDNYIGRYKTVLFLSLVYMLGNICMALTSYPGWFLGPPHWSGALISLLLIGIGTGGIKPCVSSFAGDQFSPEQAEMRSNFFYVFYFLVNLGSLLSMYITPLLRNVSCFGMNQCYPLAFGLPAILMITAVAIFWLGSASYNKTFKREDVVLSFFKLISLAIYRKARRWQAPIVINASGANSPTPHQDPDKITESSGLAKLVRDKFSPLFIRDCRRVISVFTVFLPICFFWALYDQQGSWWVYQAVQMNPKVNILGWKFAILPEQMGLVNAFLIIALLPLFTNVIYPVVNVRPLKKMGIGMGLAAVAFVMAALLQWRMGQRGTFSPSPINPATMVCTSGCISILWQLPQYVMITVAEVFLSVTGLDFGYSQAPNNMKSVCQAAWLLTVAGGNLIVIFVTLINPIKWFSPHNAMAANFIMWTIFMVIGTILFILVARGYVYREPLREHLEGQTAMAADTANQSNDPQHSKFQQQ